MHGYIVRFFPSDTPRDTFVSCYQNFSIQTPKSFLLFIISFLKFCPFFFVLNNLPQVAESQIFPHFIELLKKKENEEFFFQEFVCPSNLKTKENWFWKYLYPSSREHFVGLQVYFFLLFFFDLIFSPYFFFLNKETKIGEWRKRLR